jgi:hypothetical protein
MSGPNPHPSRNHADKSRDKKKCRGLDDGQGALLWHFDTGLMCHNDAILKFLLRNQKHHKQLIINILRTQTTAGIRYAFLQVRAGPSEWTVLQPAHGSRIRRQTRLR